MNDFRIASAAQIAAEIAFDRWQKAGCEYPVGQLQIIDGIEVWVEIRTHGEPPLLGQITKQPELQLT